MADTFDDYLSAGTTRGVAFRFVIEGCPYEFVSDLAMEQALSDGRVRVRGLLPEGLSVSESAYLAGAELDVSLSTVSICETAGPYRNAAARAFTSWIGWENKTWLGASVAVGDGTITVIDTSGIVATDTVHVGTEAMYVNSVDDATTLTVVRGSWRTTAQAFNVETETTAGLDLDIIPVSTTPACYAGRRCWLYGHGLDELTEFDGVPYTGTLLWRGVLAADPDRVADATWQISVGPRLSLFDAKIGSERLSETKLRGAYYPDEAPFAVSMFRQNGASHGDTFLDLTQASISGHFEDQESFCTALAAAVNAVMVAAGWGGTCAARPVGDVWELFYTTAAATEKHVQFYEGSPIDGWFNGRLYTAGSFGYYQVDTVDPSTEYRVGWGSDRPFTRGTITGYGTIGVARSSLRRMPRACYTRWLGDLGTLTYPMGRWYLDSTSGYLVGYSMVITPPAADGESESLPLPTITVVTRDATGGYVEALDASLTRREWSAAGASQPTISLAIRFNTDTGANLADFMAYLTANSPALANSGIMPLITSDDVASWSTEVSAAAAGRAWLLRRDYVFAKPQKLIDIVKHECRTYGLFLRLDSDGLVSVKRIRPDVDTPSTIIDETRHAPDGESHGSLRISPDGMIGSVVYKFAYDPGDDKHAVTYTFVNRGAQVAARGKAQPIEIAPMVNPTSGGLVLPDGVKDAVASLLSLYGSRRYVYEIPVSMHCHSLRLGDGALLTIPTLPYEATSPGSTATSDLGLLVTRGTVIGRAWSYGEEPRGRLTFLVHGLDLVGYAPTGRAASFSGAGVAWDVTLEAAHYGPGGAIADAAYFVAGMRVSLDKWDTATPVAYVGTVGAVAGNVVSITFDGAFPGAGGDTWNLRFADSDDASLTDGQKRYAYIAGELGAIVYAASTRVANLFA